MSRSVYSSQLICEHPRVWYLAIGAEVTLEQSAALIREMARQLAHTTLHGLIVDYRAATLRRHPYEYTELALSISVNIPPMTQVAYITGARNSRPAALMVKLLRERQVSALGFQRWDEMIQWVGIRTDICDPLPRKSDDIVLI